jgi:hypothetical protein
MSEVSFKSTFSWKPGSQNEKWTWHDKTPFPWDRIIKRGFPDGGRMPGAEHILTAAERVAESLRLKGAGIAQDIRHRGEDTRKRVDMIWDKIGRALDELMK